MPKFQLPWWLHLIFWLVLSVFVGSIARMYVSTERTFYAGDFYPVHYHQAVQIAVETWRGGNFWQNLQQSLGRDHNQLFTLGLLPWLLNFGTTRADYVTGVALLYLLPFCLVTGAIARRLVRGIHPDAVFWLATFLGLLLPTTWLPTLRGYPDVCGAIAIVWAYWLALPPLLERFPSPQFIGPDWQFGPLEVTPPLLEQLTWRRAGGIGLCLGVAMLLRRHFAYADIAFLLALAGQGLVYQERGNWLKMGARLAAMAAIALGTLMLVAGHFTWRALTTDFRSLYASWSLPLGEILSHYGNFYGWLVWLMVIVGFWLAAATRLVERSLLWFLGIALAVNLINILGILRYDSFQYSLHLTPLVILGGVMFWACVCWLFPSQLRLIALGSSLGLGINFLLMLTTLGSWQLPGRSLFAANFPPQVRRDYQEVVQIVDFLRQIAPKKAPIYVISSSAMDPISRGVLTSAEVATYGKDRSKLTFLRPQSFDSSSSYPLEELLKAQVVVVPQPLTYRFHPSEHDVARVAHSIFSQNWEMAQDFEQLPQTFRLGNGAIVSIYRRRKPTDLPTAIRTLARIQAEIKERPGGQGPWLILSQINPTQVSVQKDQTYKIIAQAGYRTGAPTMAMVYLNKFPDQVQVSGQIKFLDSLCGGVSLRLGMYDRQGSLKTMVETFKSPNFAAPFFLTTPTMGADYLVWLVTSPNEQDLIDHCVVEIDNWRIY